MQTIKRSLYCCNPDAWRKKGKISNADFQELYGVSKATATRDLTELVEKYELFEKLGQTGAGTAYILKK